MPQNAETNYTFGLYRNVCCGEEILSEGEIFPDCRNHPKLTTIWKPTTNKIVRLEPRFVVGDPVKVVGSHRRKGTRGVVVQVFESPRDFVHRYEVRFSDESFTKCFGFELQLISPESSKTA